MRSEQIDGWLRNGKLVPTTRNTCLTLVRLLFNFAKQRIYLPKAEATEADAVPEVKCKATDTEIFEPEEIQGQDADRVPIEKQERLVERVADRREQEDVIHVFPAGISGLARDAGV